MNGQIENISSRVRAVIADMNEYSPIKHALKIFDCQTVFYMLGKCVGKLNELSNLYETQAFLDATGMSDIANVDVYARMIIKDTKCSSLYHSKLHQE